MNLSDEAVYIMREACRTGLDFNCTFVDDEMRLLVALAQRAILAGLAKDADPKTLARMIVRAEENRAGHELVLGGPIKSALD